MSSSSNWSFWRWMRESRSYTRPMPWWRFYPAAVRKWPAFNRQQLRDAQ
jgi:hypothetical protein